MKKYSAGVKAAAVLGITTSLALWVLLAPYLADRLIVLRPLERADAILVMAGSSAFVERTDKAAALFGQHVAPLVVLTNDGVKAGWSREEQRNPSYLELAKRRLVANGVPESAVIVLPSEVSSTLSEAQLLGRESHARRWKSLLIVTSAYHTRRALATFERQFAANGGETRIGIIPAPQDTQSSRHWWLSRRGWRDVGGEYVKSAYYALFY